MNQTPQTPALIRKATETDLLRMAEIHFHAMPETFLAKLGLAYLQKKFYPKLFQYPGNISLVAEVDLKVQAFVTFVPNGAEFERYLTSSRVGEVFYVLGGIARHPAIVLDIAAILRGTKVHLNPEWEGVFEAAELFSIASDASCRSKGLGAQLVSAGLTMLADAGHRDKRCYVRTDTERAAAFYRRCGFVDAGLEYRAQTKRMILGREVGQGWPNSV